MAELDRHPMLAVRRREIEALHVVLDLPPPVRPLWEDCPAELEALCELSYDAGLDHVGVMTRGVGAAFVERLGVRLDGLIGADAAADERAHLELALARSTPPALFMKVDRGPEGVAELSWYSVAPRSPEDAAALLAELGVPQRSGAQLLGLWLTAGAGEVFVGRSVAPSGVGRWVTYAPLSGTHGEPARAGLFRALRQADVQPAQRDLVRLHHGRLLCNEHRRVFLGLGLDDGPGAGLSPGLKLDYEAPLPDAVEGLLTDLGLDTEHRAALRAVGELLDSPRPSYLGLRLGARGARVKLYLGRFPALAALPV